MHAYLGGVVKRLGGIPLEVGGTNDHVHLLAGLRATQRLSDVLRELKSSSSGWIRTELRCPLFAWQDGYGGFTVGRDGIDATMKYVRKQVQHHRHVTFEDEYVGLLKQAGIEYDERYLW